jgi:hypothetical protein
MRIFAGAITLTVAMAVAFAAGRSTLPVEKRPNPIRLKNGIPVGVSHTPAGAVAAADNYVAAGITASLDPRALRAFANALLAVRARQGFMAASERLAEGSSPPAGTSAIATVVAHALRSYGGDTAEVSTWELGSYWGAGLAPTQYWALADLSLRWSDRRWRVVSVQERLPGPVPARVTSDRAARTSAIWDQALTGMSAPYYGDGG